MILKVGAPGVNLSGARPARLKPLAQRPMTGGSVHSTLDTAVAPPARTAPAEPARGHLLLFNDDRFHALNLGPGQRYLRVDHARAGALAGSLCGALADGVFRSGFSAPFGGVDFVRPDAPLPEVDGLLERALDVLTAAGAREIRIKAKPPFYGAAEPVLHHCLVQRGFRVEHSDLNHHIDLGRLTDMTGYLAGLGRKRAYLHQDLSEPYRFAEAETPAEVRDCYAVIERNRERKGYPAGLAVEYLLRLRAALPGRVHVYGLARDGRVCAAAVVYRVLPRRDLMVAWGDVEADVPRSPMNLLAYRLVERSLTAGAHTLDLGPSSERDGSLNAGLFQFKRGLLAEPSTRLTFVRREVA